MTATIASPRPQPAISLRGRCALVTGAGRGLGQGIALALAGAGADVQLVSRTAHEVEAAAASARALGVRAHVHVSDLTDDAEVARLVEAAAPFDVLVNNAGTNVPGPLHELATSDLDRMLALNVRSVLVLTRAVVARWLRDGVQGAVLNVSSQMGHVGDAGRVAYCTTKHAIEGFTKALAVELAPHGMRVNAVAPTYVETPMTAPFLAEPAFRDATLGRIPLGRFGRISDITTGVVFLVSDHAGLITGTSLVIDGGYTAQ